MIPPAYLLAVTTTGMSAEVLITIYNKAGRGHSLQGFSNGMVHTDLWIIKKGRNSREEVLSQLEALPEVRSVFIAVLSNPVPQNELKEVRKLFAQIGWDASDLTDEALTIYIDSKLQGQYNYYIDYHLQEKAPVKIQIKRIEDHPDFSPEWLEGGNPTDDDGEDRDLTIEDIVMETEGFVESIEDPPDPPPPPDNPRHSR